MHPKARKTQAWGARNRSHIAAAAPPSRGASKTFEELVAGARCALDELDSVTATLLFEEALELKPDDLGTLDALGELCFADGDSSRAREIFNRAVALHPAEVSPAGAARWLYLGELDEGAAAAEKLLRGITLLRRYLEGAESDGDDVRRSSQRDLSGALCSLAELYMTDLCDEPDAEVRSDEYATAAVAADESNPEAHRVLADVRLCQKQPPEAVAPIIRRSLELLQVCYPPEIDDGDDLEAEEAERGGSAAAVSYGVPRARVAGGPAALGMTVSASAAPRAAGSGESSRLDPTAVQAKLLQLPPYDSRLRAAQIAMEVEEYAAAVGALVRLLEEDDSAMEVWFLLGEAHLHLGERETAAEYLEDAEAMLTEAIATISGMSRTKKKLGAASLALAQRQKQQVASGGLLAFSKVELTEQLEQIRRLLAVVRSGAPSSGASAKLPATGSTSMTDV
jgi:tetratricopeptide (TPR) repeat protein